MIDQLPKSTRHALFWTRIGMVAERLTRAFWPLWSVALASLAALMLGLHEVLPLEAAWTLSVSALLGMGWAAYLGVNIFVWPTSSEAMERLDATLPGRPLTALGDTQAIGSGDAASRAVWDAHRGRMQATAATAKPVPANLRVARADPFALRYVAVLALAVAILFGSILRVGTVTDLGPGQATAAIGPSWEGWIEPPLYTGKHTIYLPDIPAGAVTIPQGSRITLRLYGQVGAMTVAETVSARVGELPPASDLTQTFEANQNGTLIINGPGGRTWDIVLLADTAPSIEFSFLNDLIDDPSERKAEFQQAFAVRDDYGVERGLATIRLNVEAVDRRYGLAIAPDARPDVELDLPMTISGDRADFTDTLIEDFSEHPFANLPVVLKLQAEDALGQTGVTEDRDMVLPGRRFFDPLAKAVIEQRRDLMWSRENAGRVAQILRAVSYQPTEIFRRETSALKLQAIVRRLETITPYGLRPEQQDQIVDALWDFALELEEGDLADAAERLRRAQERLQEAIENGASDEEIAQLMQELREAMQDYMQQLAEQQNPSEAPQNPENTQEMTSQDLQDMLDRLQELMEEGRMAEAQELLQQLQQMMENMQVTQGQQGQQGQSEGEQAMEGLAETLREQQGLSDEAFRDLQEQFNPNAQAGENEDNEGRNGGQGRGESHEGEGGEEGDGRQGQGQQDSLANRQQDLRNELNRQRQNLPGAGTPEGEAARDSLSRADRAMDDAEQALRDNNLAEAIDNQAEAMDALRDGLQNLGDALAQERQQDGQGQQNQQQGQNAQPQQRDPLGRDPDGRGSVQPGDDLLQGEDVYRRAQDLLEELRRRSAEADRPEVERNYLERLLDRF